MILKVGTTDGCAVVTSNGIIPASWLCSTPEQAQGLREIARELKGQRCTIRRVRVHVEIIDDPRSHDDD